MVKSGSAAIPTSPFTCVTHTLRLTHSHTRTLRHSQTHSLTHTHNDTDEGALTHSHSHSHTHTREHGEDNVRGEVRVCCDPD